jgi:hypothetical protein
MDFTKALEKLTTCKFGLDANQNATCAGELLDLKLKTMKKAYELRRGWEDEKRKLMNTEEVQKGKNAEVREAIIELKLTGSPFEDYRPMEKLLEMISAVERHNDQILKLFFEGAK